MVFEEILSKIDEEEKSSGNGYYDVFIVGDMVIKRYEDSLGSKGRFDNDVKKHNDLDDRKLLPKMIANFHHDIYFYLIVEKVLCLDHKWDGDKQNTSYFKYLRDKIEDDDFFDSISEYEKELCGLNYTVHDVHAGNFGYDKDHNFVCLDEGCLYYEE